MLELGLARWSALIGSALRRGSVGDLLEVFAEFLSVVGAGRVGRGLRAVCEMVREMGLGVSLGFRLDGVMS